MCREAVASGSSNFSDGLNRSILFMLGMVLVIPAGFAFVVWRSYRSDASRAGAGAGFAPEGKVRWDERGS